MTADVHRTVQAKLDEMVAANTQLGIQAAVYQHGELIVDAWSGHTDPSRTTLVARDALFPIFSCSKGLMYTVIHLLAERGELDYDARVREYWPEFGQKGKAEATIRQVLIHTSGVQDITHDFHLYDWDGTCARLAASEALWDPGTETAYRGLSSGFILGEVARRVYGAPFGQIVAELICEPLAVTDLFFGVPASVKDRIAILESDESVLTGPAASPDTRIMADLFNTPSIQASAIPAGGAITSARSLAKHYASLIGDGVDGVRLLPRARTTIATTLETDAYDRTHKTPVRRGLGYQLGDTGIAMGGRITSFGHSGFGGSYGFADPDYGLSFALTTNRLVSTVPPEVPASVVLANTVREALSIPND
ncbi:serine hydrolase domain-containing protein [Rhodococcus globerulus]|uniref:Serine hydrolase domain-containing protein n=1 Tax=Rhodococcus globerulus TaxID=33008 RepID=A0ABU4C3G9_RHOGO|nr:serine hydrolase domain-containing protein [Rhodococcus globerulus]MDV6271048.1 serine hydrolase domain-containing protein [Rhodococcus globerulus]